MGELDARGIISAVEIAVYVPILLTSLVLVKRHGFKRQGGWIFLLIFSLVRVVAASVHIAAEVNDPTDYTLQAIYTTLEGVGLAPLLSATVGFLVTVSQNGLDRISLVSRGNKILGLLSLAALALTVAGGAIVGSAKTEDRVNTGTNLRHIGIILFAVQYGLIVLMDGYFWANKEQIMRHRRTLLLGITLALPFLGVRMLYAVLSAFSPTSVPGSPPPSGGLSKFNSQTGPWEIYLVMSVIAEFVTVLIYTIVGVITPLKKDYTVGNRDADDDQTISLKPR